MAKSSLTRTFLPKGVCRTVPSSTALNSGGSGRPRQLTSRLANGNDFWAKNAIFFWETWHDFQESLKSWRQLWWHIAVSDGLNLAFECTHFLHRLELSFLESVHKSHHEDLDTLTTIVCLSLNQLWPGGIPMFAIQGQLQGTVAVSIRQLHLVHLGSKVNKRPIYYSYYRYDSGYPKWDLFQSIFKLILCKNWDLLQPGYPNSFLLKATRTGTTRHCTPTFGAWTWPAELWPGSNPLIIWWEDEIQLIS